MIVSTLKRIVKNIIWYFKGKSLSNPIITGDKKRFLYICKGNICRSPFAEFISLKLSELPRNEYAFSSAGIFAKEGEKAPQNAIKAAAKHQVDMSAHKSKKLDSNIIEANDLLIVMEPNQIRELTRMFNIGRDKIILLPLFDNHDSAKISTYEKYHLIDPYGGDSDRFDACYARIVSCTTNMLNIVRGHYINPAI